MRSKIGAAKLPILPTSKNGRCPRESGFLGDRFSQGEIQCRGEISMDTSTRTKELPMTVSKESSIG